MKKIVFTLFIITLTIKGFSQENQTQKNEYASLYLKVYYQGNIIQYDKKGWSRSPILYMPGGNVVYLYDGTDPNKPIEIKSINGAINYMAKFGWILKTNVMLPYSGGAGNASNSDLINTSVYIQELTFERPLSK